MKIEQLVISRDLAQRLQDAKLLPHNTMYYWDNIVPKFPTVVFGGAIYTGEFLVDRYIPAPLAIELDMPQFPNVATLVIRRENDVWVVAYESRSLGDNLMVNSSENLAEAFGMTLLSLKATGVK